MPVTSERLPRSFTWLNTTQFLGALNDNVFKLLLIFFLITLEGPESAGRVAALAGGVFVVPFLLFSPLAGNLADRIGKSRIIIASKGMEVGVMILATAGFWVASPGTLYLALFLMALQSTLFSPAKYGIVPEIVHREALSKANGLLEALTYLAIIVGTALATLLPSLTQGRYVVMGLACTGVALAGLAASFGIGCTAPARDEGEAVSTGGFRRGLAALRADRHLTLAVLGSAAFMLLGAFVQLNLIPLGMQDLGLSQEGGGALFLLAAFGIGVGSLAAGRLSGRNVELGIVPLGALLLTLSALVLGTFSARGSMALPAIFLLGVGGGLFIVPLNALIQLRAPREDRGKVLAAANLLGWSGVLAAALLTHLMSVSLALPASYGFIAVGLIAASLTAAALFCLPDFLLRFIALAIMRLAYRVKVRGIQNVPTEGGALLVANHVSWIDALLLLATQQRRIRFLMERRIYRAPLLVFLFRLMGVIPIASGDGRRELIASLREARNALDEGYLVCIFAEGAITRTGALQAFRPGFGRIVEGSDHPVIPIHIGGLWGSIFSYADGRLFARLPSLVPGRALVSFGAPLPATASAAEVRQAVMELSCDDFDFRKREGRSLARRFVETARSHWGRRAVADTMGRNLSYGTTLAGALALAGALEKSLDGRTSVGILLPPSVGGALANLAVTLSGRVPVNLNYTASKEGFASAIAQADIGAVVTSRRFLEKVGDFPLPDRTIFLEEILPGISRRAKGAAWLKARLLPASLLLRRISSDPDALATIIFSSGSTGEPKGVMLSQHNILSNIEALRAVFPLEGRDNLCGVLPFFHSFGFTGTLWLPLLCGFSAVYHPSPLEAGKIAETVRSHRSTFLLATPTFLASYLRKATPDDFASLRFVVTGAEKLKSSLAGAFAAKYGITPLEGYGATELSPVAALNLPDVQIGTVCQRGSRPHSVGRPLPGMAVKIVHPETGADLPSGAEGMILFKGPNVMLGYLGRPEKTAEAIREGWYVTGDIGRLDDHGFVHITGRLARFSKIGGEMVPHGAVEEAILDGLGTTEPVAAVTAVADERRGERLVVVHTREADPRELRRIIEKSALPNLWKPDRDAYLAAEALPLLGSGKLDLQALRRMAEGSLGAERSGLDPCASATEMPADAKTPAVLSG
jgi:acyl-[acyl-carrier-protein]-phospholipid O-acyltransferase / long-chain-fatty-acid--[acyl-carrier-protein] ligase